MPIKKWQSFTIIAGIAGFIFYTFAVSHLKLLEKIDAVEYEMKLLTGELTKLVESTFKIDDKGVHREKSQNDKLNVIMKENVRKFKLQVNHAILKIKDIQQNQQQKQQSEHQQEGNKQRNSIQIPHKINKPDFALESLGAEIISIGQTKIFRKRAWYEFYKSKMNNGQRNLLNPSNQPGECFGYYGAEANITIKLMGYVFIDSISIEHIPVEISPTRSIDTAPKEFLVYGLNDLGDDDSFYFGKFIYDINKSTPVQTFYFEDVQTISSFQLIHFQFISNHGNLEHTCIYKIQVHGELDKTKIHTEL